MKLLKVKNTFSLNGTIYEKNDEIECEKLKIEEIIRLNEKGFIEPLTRKEIISLTKEKENKTENKIFNKPLKIKEGEE